MRPVVILDRDGTLIDFVRDEELGVVTPAFHPDHVRVLPGVLEGLTRLARAGFALAVATNQPGPAKGEVSEEAVRRVNARLRDIVGQHGLELAASRTCLHHPTGGPGGRVDLTIDCSCRKPKPGLLLEILAELAAPPERSWMLGDTLTDLHAGQAAGMNVGLVQRRARCELCPHPRVSPSALGVVPAWPVFDSLIEAAQAIAP